MSTDVEGRPDQTAASLLSGILGDLQQLIEEQFQLTRREIEDEFRKRAAAASILFLGIGILFLDAIVLCFTSAHLLHWVASPPGTDLHGFHCGPATPCWRWSSPSWVEF